MNYRNSVIFKALVVPGARCKGPAGEGELCVINSIVIDHSRELG
jgi:hypothetical protein